MERTWEAEMFFSSKLTVKKNLIGEIEDLIGGYGETT
jgi:hypothetical protein